MCDLSIDVLVGSQVELEKKERKPERKKERKREREKERKKEKKERKEKRKKGKKLKPKDNESQTTRLFQIRQTLKL